LCGYLPCLLFGGCLKRMAAIWISSKTSFIWQVVTFPHVHYFPDPISSFM